MSIPGRIPFPIVVRARNIIQLHRNLKRNREPLRSGDGLKVQEIIREINESQLSEIEKKKLLKELIKIRTTHMDAGLTYLEEIEQHR